MIPNEKLAGGILKNDTLVVDVVALDVSVWLPPEADVERAIAALRGRDGPGRDASPRPSRGARGWPSAATRCRPPDRAPREAALRRQCLQTAACRRAADGRLTEADLEFVVRP